MANRKSDKYTTINHPAESKQTQAYRQIREDILNNTYPEGTVMIERKLCEIYQVSRSPIRNALQKLNHEGLLSFVPGKGMVVASFSTEDILEVYDLIELLQTYAVQICIARNPDGLIPDLTAITREMKQSMDGNDIFTCTRQDQQFHELLIEYTKNKRLQAIYLQLAYQQVRFMTSILDDAALAARSLSEHEAILDAIREKDTAKAQECVREHYRNIKQYYINKLLARL